MGMGGVQRTSKFAKYLPLYGWLPHVLTVTPKVYLAEDYCLLDDVRKSGVKVFRTGKGLDENNGHVVVSFRKESSRKFLSNLSQTFLIPDSKIFWKKQALELGSRIIYENDIDLIFATAPPYTDFLVGKELKSRFDLPLVLDYRDSWADCPNNFYPTPFHKKFHTRLEEEVLRSADMIITINERIKELITERYDFTAEEKISVIPQGYDPEDFAKHIADESKKKFRITYSGSFMNYYTPKYFLDALKIINENRRDIADETEAMFIGTFPQTFVKYIKESGIESMVTLTGYLKHSECVNKLLNSDVLWMMINRSSMSDLHSTGKLYEYFGTYKPILACVPDGVARNSLKGHNACIITEPDDSDAIAEAIMKFFELYKSDSLPKPDNSFIEYYNRKKLTQELAEIFNSLTITSRLEV